MAPRNAVAPAPAPARLPSASPPFPRRSLRLGWLRSAFAGAREGTEYTWQARDFLKAEHGGGEDGVVRVRPEDLQEHRRRMDAAGRDGDGKPTSVQYVNIPFELLTTNDVCFAIVKPETAHAACAYADMLVQTDPRQVGDATAFVSHAWKYKFVNVIDALENLPDDTFVWFDVFTVNQHASLQVPPDWWFTTFKEAVASIQHTVLVLMPWDDPIPLTRAWCIWEILSTIDGKAKFEICLPAVEQKAFADFLVTEGTDKVIVKMVGIDVQRAQAWKKEDLDAILRAVRSYQGGASAVNKVVKDQMRTWVVESARNALEVLDVQERATSQVLMSVANVLADQGKYAEAEPLYREAVEGRERKLGDAHPDTLASIHGLAELLRNRGMEIDAEREALKASRRELGNSHPDTLTSIHKLANLLKNQGKYAEAESLYREALEGRRRELGDAHPDTRDSIHELAKLLLNQYKLVNADALFRELIEMKRQEMAEGLAAMLHIDLATAERYVEMAGGDVGVAASLYYEVGPAGVGMAAAMEGPDLGVGAAAMVGEDAPQPPALPAHLLAAVPPETAGQLQSHFDGADDDERAAMLAALEAAASGGDRAAVTAAAAMPPQPRDVMAIDDDDDDDDDDVRVVDPPPTTAPADDPPPQGIDPDMWAALPPDVKADVRRQHEPAPPSSAAAPMLPDGMDAEEARMLEAAMLGVPYEPPEHRRPVDPATAAAAAAAGTTDAAALRFEQDDAYEASLRADRAREEERARAEAEAAAAAEAERAESKRKEDEAAAALAAFAESDEDAPPEPQAGARVALRLPNGTRVQRRFDGGDSLLMVRRWARRSMLATGAPLPDGAWSLSALGGGPALPSDKSALAELTVGASGVGGSMLAVVSPSTQ